MMAMTDMIDARYDETARPIIFPDYLYKQVYDWANSTPNEVEQMGVLYTCTLTTGDLVFLHKHKATGRPNPVELPPGGLERIIEALQSVNLAGREDECQAILMHSHPSNYPKLTRGDCQGIYDTAKDTARRNVLVYRHVVWPHKCNPRAYEVRVAPQLAVVEIPLQIKKISEAELDSTNEIGWRKRQLLKEG